jgi:UDP-sugar transporter A1/2/3
MYKFISHQVEQKSSEKLLSTDDRLYGFVCILSASCLSGFAGVYFEKILKGTPASVWLRNVQLALVSVPFALVTCFVSEGGSIREKGFHHGYDALVWLVIMLTSLGGLIVAVVIKYADNILKGFATSIAIVIGCVANIFLFGVDLNLQFLLGTSLVVSAVWLYG